VPELHNYSDQLVIKYNARTSRPIDSLSLLELVSRNGFSGLVGQNSCRETKLQFSDRQLQISDRGDMGVQSFNFAHKFPLKNWGLPYPRFCIFGENKFPTG